MEHASYLDTSWGLITPGWVTWGGCLMLKDPKDPKQKHPRLHNISDDVSRLHQKVCVETVQSIPYHAECDLHIQRRLKGFIREAIAWGLMNF